MPLSLHISTVRGQPEAGWLGPMSSVDPKIAEFVGHHEPLPRPVDLLATTDYYVKRGIGEMIFSGVFERHPKLMTVCVEFETGFVPHFLNRMDFTYKDVPDRHQLTGDGRFKNGMLPSDFWYRNVRITFQEDPLGLQLLRHLVGPQTMMWGNDYPHRESTWPRSQAAIEEIFQGGGGTPKTRRPYRFGQREQAVRHPLTYPAKLPLSQYSVNLKLIHVILSPSSEG